MSKRILEDYEEPSPLKKVKLKHDDTPCDHPLLVKRQFFDALKRYVIAYRPPQQVQPVDIAQPTGVSNSANRVIICGNVEDQIATSLCLLDNIPKNPGTEIHNSSSQINDVVNQTIDNLPEESMLTTILNYAKEKDYESAAENILFNLAREKEFLDMVADYYVMKQDTDSIGRILTIAYQKGSVYALYGLVNYYKYIKKDEKMTVEHCVKLTCATNESKYLIFAYDNLIEYYAKKHDPNEEICILLSIENGEYKYLNRLLSMYTKNGNFIQFMAFYKKYGNITVNLFKLEYEMAISYFIHESPKEYFVELFKTCYSFDSPIIKRKFIGTLEKMYNNRILSINVSKASLLSVFELIDICYLDCVEYSFKSLVISVKLALEKIPKNENYERERITLFRTLTVKYT